MSTDRPPSPADVSILAPFPAELAPTALDPLTEQVAQALEQPPKEQSWLQGAILLGITLALFAMTGFFSSPLIDLAIIVGVLLFHESGHYLGMRIFNYQDVRMFFIPFFGAAVSGRSTSVQGYKEAIVLLLGPLPGIALGVALGILCLSYDSPLLRQSAFMLMIVNGFNLLPLLPLDGGRLLHLILFSRQHHAEAIFRVVTCLLLGLVAWALGAWLLGLVALGLLIGTWINFRVSRLAQQLRLPREPGQPMDLSARIPRDWSLPLIERVRQTFPEVKDAKTLANLARQVWERIHLEPPGIAASLLLLAVYAASFFGTPLVAALFSNPIETVVVRTNAEGRTTRVQETRSWGAVIRETELSGDRFHGRHVEYFHGKDQIKVEGSYLDDKPHGVWTTYQLDGQVQSRVTYDRGRRVGNGP